MRGGALASGAVPGSRTNRTALLAALAALVAPGAAAAEGPPERSDTRQVMFVGNNWDGTADVVDVNTFQRLGRINVIPDKDERLAEIALDPVRLAFFLAIRQQVGEGHDQFVDDMFSTHDGTLVAVSRPSLADVVGIDLRSHQIVWRFPMEGQRSDHMAVSPDGESLLVSDSTANKVHRLDMRTGRKTGEFASGDSPHESNYTRDGARIFHASIGRVYTPTDRGELGAARSTSKGERVFEIVDGHSLQVLKRWDMGQKLKDAGYDDMESAVRPMAVAPDERMLYLQISFFHGFVEFDTQTEKVTRVARLPVADKTKDTPPEDYLLDSAHHGLAIDASGRTLCAAGTMSDYGALVDRATFAYKLFSDIGSKPYWATNDHAGKHCWMSVSGDDRVVVLDYASKQEIARIPVGDHPQRVRPGAIQRSYVRDLPAGPAATNGFTLALDRRATRRRDAVTVGCRASGSPLTRCDVRLRAAVHGRGRPVTIGTGRATAAQGRATLPVSVRLTSAGRALARRRAGGFRVTATAVGRDAGGALRRVSARLTVRRR